MATLNNNLALDQIFAILKSATDDNTPIPPTLLYNENWLLRLILSAASQGIPCLPFEFAAGARWFSEARLYSRFLPRGRGDRNAETHTHADGVIGHFAFAMNSKTGLLLDSTGSQFVVLEAKVFSKLRKTTQNADNYDQAVRTLGCMAESLRRSGKFPEQWQSLGFYVIAPKGQIDRGLFNEAMHKDHVLKGIHDRIEGFDSDSPGEMKDWEGRWVKPLLERVHMECLTWEHTIEKVEEHDPALGRDVRIFYDRTLEFNKPKKLRGNPVPGQQFSVLFIPRA